MILYFLVGNEILKQRRFFKSIESSFVNPDSLNNTSFNHKAVPMTMKDNPRIPKYPLDQRQGKELDFETSASASTSSQRPLDSAPFDLQPQRRPPVSFGQYILMPVMFFFLLLMIWVAPTVNRVASFINPKFFSFPLYIAVGSMGSLRGFCNAVVFIVVGMKERRRKRRLGT
jgi:hypothetical protein